MKVCFWAVLLLLLITSGLFADQSKTVVKLETKTGILEGSLIVPNEKTQCLSH